MAKASIPRPVDAHPAAATKLVALSNGIDHCRSKLYVAIQALHHGETDLELHCARVIKEAFDEIEQASDDLSSMRGAVAAYEREVAHG